MRKLKCVLLSCGQKSDRFGSHSLQRGGASWALKCGLSGDMIRILGDWKLDAYWAYLEVPLIEKLNLVKQLANQVLARV